MERIFQEELSRPDITSNGRLTKFRMIVFSGGHRPAPTRVRYAAIMMRMISVRISSTSGICCVLTTTICEHSLKQHVGIARDFLLCNKAIQSTVQYTSHR